MPKVRDLVVASSSSKLVPPYLKRTKNVEEFIPWLYLKGISTGEMQPALEALLGAREPPGCRRHQSAA